MLSFGDRVKEMTIVSGVGNYTFAGAYVGMRGFLATLGAGATCQYCAESATSWEIGEGTINIAGYITRDKVISSSNGNALVSWPSNSYVTLYDTVTSDLLQNLVRKGVTVASAGVLSVNQGNARWYPPNNCTVTAWDAWVGTASSGGNIGFAARKNGAVVATGAVLAGLYRMTHTAIAIPLTTSDYLTLDVTTVGTTVVGSDLTVRFTI